jgi:CheY-like chemotaxis protein
MVARYGWILKLEKAAISILLYRSKKINHEIFMKHDKPILVVDDDLVDAMTIRRAFKDIDMQNQLILTGNGEEALLFLRDNDNEKPSLIILDLNMPKMSGLELLQILKRDEFLKQIPVIILTTSRDEQDKIYSFSLSVAGYFVKPVDYLQFLDVMKVVKHYWSMNELPK